MKDSLDNNRIGCIEVDTIVAIHSKGCTRLPEDSSKMLNKGIGMMNNLLDSDSMESIGCYSIVDSNICCLKNIFSMECMSLTRSRLHYYWSSKKGTTYQSYLFDVGYMNPININFYWISFLLYFWNHSSSSGTNHQYSCLVQHQGFEQYFHFQPQYFLSH